MGCHTHDPLLVIRRARDETRKAIGRERAARWRQTVAEEALAVAVSLLRHSSYDTAEVRAFLADNPSPPVASSARVAQGPRSTADAAGGVDASTADAGSTTDGGVL